VRLFGTSAKAAEMPIEQSAELELARDSLQATLAQ
jgi:hypothetical protein